MLPSAACSAHATFWSPSRPPQSGRRATARKGAATRRTGKAKEADPLFPARPRNFRIGGDQQVSIPLRRRRRETDVREQALFLRLFLLRPSAH